MTISGNFQWAVFRWILLYLPLYTQSSTDALSLSVPKKPVHVWMGSSQVMLPCSTQALLTNSLQLRWHRPDGYKTPVLLYERQQVQLPSADPQYRDRVALVGEPQKGNFSLLLQNITLLDRGEFVCFVAEKKGYSQESVQLFVKAMGSYPVLSARFRGSGQANVTCSSHGWSPKPSLTWRDSHNREVSVESTQISTDAKGFTSVTSWLLRSTSDSDWLSCSVGVSDAEMRECRVLLHGPKPEGKIDPFIGLFITAVLLPILGALAFLMYRKYKTREYGAVNTTDTTDANESEDQVTRILLVGKTGVGKGATGNTILGREAFQSRQTTGSEKQCGGWRVEGEVNGRRLCVVDTPDLFGQVNDKRKKMVECFALSSPGPHVFLVVLHPDRFSAEERDTVKNIKENFGNDADKHTIALFTHGEELEGKPIMDFIKESEYHKALKDFIGQCHGRCHVFTNDGRADRTQVTTLLEMIDKVKEEQRGHFRSKKYQKVEKEIKRRRADLTTWIEEQVLVGYK